MEMWSLYSQAAKFSQRPSKLLEIDDKWDAYQFDAAVNLLGTVIENARQEMHNVGSEQSPKWEAKYKMSQLLDDKFRLPAAKTERERQQDDISVLQSMARQVSTNPMMKGAT